MKYRLVKKGIPNKPDAPKKWYATAVNQGTINIKEISKEIAGRSSLTKGDVLNVIENLLEEIPKHLINGNSVKLGDLCTLRLSIKGKGSEDEEDYTTANIQKTRVVFTPSKAMQKEISEIKFERVK